MDCSGMRADNDDPKSRVKKPALPRCPIPSSSPTFRKRTRRGLSGPRRCPFASRTSSPRWGRECPRRICRAKNSGSGSICCTRTADRRGRICWSVRGPSIQQSPSTSPERPVVKCGWFRQWVLPGSTCRCWRGRRTACCWRSPHPRAAGAAGSTDHTAEASGGAGSDHPDRPGAAGGLPGQDARTGGKKTLRCPCATGGGLALGRTNTGPGWYAGSPTG